MSDITINVEPPKPVTVALGTAKYKVRPIKGSLGMALSQRLQNKAPEEMVKGVEHIINIMFGKADAAKVIKRLGDPEDALDYTHIIELMTALMERTTGNPTT